jgi:uncharacterized caspase-like protein
MKPLKAPDDLLIESMTRNTSLRIFVRGLPMKRRKGFLSGKWIALSVALLLCCPVGFSGWIEGGGSVVAAASQQRRVALVVGNNAYPQMPLENAVNDARVMEQTLGQLGFEVRKIENSSLIELAKAVDAFVGGLGSGDVGLFFYAGHGIQIEGENYLVPIDFEATDETVAKYKSYAAELVRERMEKAGARLSIIVLDACRNNPFKMSRSASRGLAAMNSGRGTLIAFATGPGKTASDNPVGKNGLFTHHLVENLKTPGLSLDDVFNRTRAEVDRTSSHEQTPWVVSSVIGDFSFQPEGAPPAVQATASPPAAPASKVDYSDLERIAADRQRSAAQIKEMKAAHDKARRLEDSATLTAAEKAQAWQRFLDTYRADDPQGSEDDRLRDFAHSRIRYWRELPAPVPASTHAPAPAPTPAPVMRPSPDIKAFVNAYIATFNRGSIPEILSLYADRVDYFGQGVVGLDFIRKDKQGYYQSWPQVEHRLNGDITITDTREADVKKVTFPISFSVRNPNRGTAVVGNATNTFIIRLTRGTWKIIDEKQQVLSRKKL